MEGVRSQNFGGGSNIIIQSDQIRAGEPPTFHMSLFVLASVAQFLDNCLAFSQSLSPSL
ncbi:50S ribosomal protein L3 [Clarias magur]|uniref:50S ribosomal protein L3 n=1 Tax=Clarias magur TaxID=1594786 RepID=A0A8J4WY67_CLAMG|nr:50S ribosomal protein L3 [Clarias magur]